MSLNHEIEPFCFQAVISNEGRVVELPKNGVFRLIRGGPPQNLPVARFFDHASPHEVFAVNWVLHRTIDVILAAFVAVKGAGAIRLDLIDRNAVRSVRRDICRTFKPDESRDLPVACPDRRGQWPVGDRSHFLGEI